MAAGDRGRGSVRVVAASSDNSTVPDHTQVETGYTPFGRGSPQLERPRRIIGYSLLFFGFFGLCWETGSPGSPTDQGRILEGDLPTSR